MRNVPRLGFFWPCPARAIILAIVALSADVSVGAQPGCRQLPQETDGWWSGDGNALDLLGNNSPSATLGTPTFVPAKVGQGIEFFGADGYEVPSGLYLGPLAYGAFSMAAWVRADPIPAGGERVLVDKRTGDATASLGYLLSVAPLPGDARGAVAVRFTVADGVGVRGVATRPFVPGTWHHVAAVFGRYRNTMSIYLDGARHDMTDIDTLGPLTNDSPFFIAHPAAGFGGSVQPFDGVIDELQFFRRNVTACDIGAIVAAGGFGNCKGDTDVDGLVDYIDNCPEVANPDQTNSDIDHAGDACDCWPTTMDFIAAPGEAGGLTVGDDLIKERMGWCGLYYEAGQGTAYNMVRGPLAELPVNGSGSETCLLSGMWGDDILEPSVPAEGQGYWYVLRAANPCDVGHYGFDSGGEPRAVLPACPVSEEEVCWVSGGFWDLGSCGHYPCGVPPDCDAIIPGCNCGPALTFQPGSGCLFDPTC